ncbi:hypothetical protein RUND412_005900 [Rhizina undulata]
MANSPNDGHVWMYLQPDSTRDFKTPEEKRKKNLPVPATMNLNPPSDGHVSIPDFRSNSPTKHEAANSETWDPRRHSFLGAQIPQQIAMGDEAPHKEDWALIVTTGFNVQTFVMMLEHGVHERQESLTTTRVDINPHRDPRTYRQSLDLSGALGLVLYYLHLPRDRLQQLY